MGALYQVWKADVDPTDVNEGYTPYTFADRMQTYPMGISRREAVTVIPGANGVRSSQGRIAGAFDKRVFPCTFRVLTNRGPDAAHDLLMGAILGRDDVRLVYKTDSGVLRFTNATLLDVKEDRNNNQRYYVDFTVTWRIDTGWRLQYSENADVFLPVVETFAAANNEVFASDGSTAITADPLQILIDATGTAGVNLPTIEDTGPKVYIVGPAGGSGGMAFYNYSAWVRDTNGARVHPFFSVPYQLLDSRYNLYMDFGAQTFVFSFPGGYQFFRPFKPDYQPYYTIVEDGIINNYALSGLGTGILTGGQLTFDWQRLFG